MAENKAAARWIGRNQLGLKPGDTVNIRRVFSASNIQVGGMSAEDQQEILVTYEQLLVSRVSLEEAFAQLGKLKTALRDERPSDTMRRSGFHPVVCAILAAGEEAGRPDEGARRASDWLSERQERLTQQIRPAQREVAFSLVLFSILFTLPLAADRMFSILPPDLVTIRHNAISSFLLLVNELLYARLPTWLLLSLVWGAIGMVLVGLIKAPDRIRLRILMLGPLTRLGWEEHLTAWLSIYLPFHRASLAYADFVNAGARVCQSGTLGESFRILKADLDAGEVDSVSTAARVRPEAIPRGLEDGMILLGSLQKDPGERYINNRLGVSSRKMRQMAQRAANQGKLIRNLCLVAIAVAVLLGVYVPLLQSANL